MLGKLLRYEFKALLRIMPALYLAIMALAVVTGLNSLITGDGARGILQKLEMILGLMFVVLFVVNLIIVILRFRDNFLKDEGYLMFTLPVTEWALIASKAIAGLCTLLLTTIVGMIALFTYGFIADFTYMLEQLSRFSWVEYTGSKPVSLAILVTTALVFIFQQLCLIYASMTVSQMAPRFRGLAGFGVYLAVMIVIVNFVKEPINSRFHNSFSFGVNGLSRGDIPYIAALLVPEIVLAALFFWCTGWLLRRTLNLE